MGLTLRVRWLTPTYEAADTRDPTRAEWPPEVVRPFCGMVAAAETESDWDALRWLEQQPPPVVVHPKQVERSGGRTSYVVTQVVGPDAHTVYPVRSNGRDLRRWPRSLPSSAEATFVWPDVAAPEPVLAVLAELARRVPYVGRATSPALLDVTADGKVPDNDRDDVAVLRPVETAQDGSDGDVRLRAPYPGYVDALRDLYDAGLPPWEAGRRVPYSGPRPVSPKPEAGPYCDLIVFRFAGKASRDGRHLVALTTALRGALRAGGADVPSVHGHHDGSVRQVAFLGLPFVGREHADGRIVGMGLALPATLSAEERRDVVRAAVFGGRLSDGGADVASGDDPSPPLLRVGSVGTLQLELIDEDERRRTLQVRRWRSPAAVWATATPIVLDRFPHRGDHVAELIADSCLHAGYPRPAHVEVLRNPAVAGGVDLSSHQAVRRRGDRRQLPTRHAVLVFEQQIVGPVVVGNMRHYGLGLCVPLSGNAAGTSREPEAG